jgi:hypothetical protein
MNFFKRAATAMAAETDSLAIDLEHAIAADLKGFGRSVVGLIHHDILDHAADTVAGLKAKAQADKNRFVDRLKEIEHEASGLIENVQHVDAVIHHADNFLSGLVSATDAKADVAQQQAPVETVVAAALSPAAE